MRPISCALAAVLMSALLAAPAPAEGFLSCFEDLPLMADLRETEGTCTNFDTPAGRIAVGEAEGDVPADAVRGFYLEVLPVFGWAVAADGEVVLEREDERLVITVVDAPAGGVRVRYALAPRR